MLQAYTKTHPIENWQQPELTFSTSDIPICELVSTGEKLTYPIRCFGELV